MDQEQESLWDELVDYFYEHQFAIFVGFGIFTSMIAGIIVGLSMNDEPSRYDRPARASSASTFEPTAAETDASEEYQERKRSFGGWTQWSNGYAWNSAPEREKRSLSHALASASREGNSANYFYDALEAFYNTNDSSVLSTSLNDATRLIESGGASLPERMRRY